MANGIGRVGWRNFAPTIPSISTNGLIVNLDASNPLSYSGTGTTWTDLSGNGNNGTLYNGTSYNSTNGGTMVFDGINDYIKIPTGLPTSNSLSVWFKQPAPTGGGLVTTSLAHGGSPYLFVGLGADYLRTYDSAYGYSPNSAYIPTNWYNVTITGSSTGERKIYMNGVLTATKGIIPSYGYNTEIIIGVGYPGYFNGNVPVVHAYNRVLTQAEITNNFDALKGRFATPTYTTRTTAFATATGITDTTILNALNTFDTGLISNGLDTKMKALYPFVGGTSNTHKYNFMDARDLDVAFRLQFNGGWIHSSNGIKGNGTNTYAQTFISPTITPINDCSFGVYMRTPNLKISNGVLIGSGIQSPTPSYSFIYDVTNGYTYTSINSLFEPLLSKTGLYAISRLDPTYYNIRNNYNTLPVNTPSVSIPTPLVTIGALNNPSIINNFSDRELALSYWGYGLTVSQLDNLYTLTQAFQTTLGRQV